MYRGKILIIAALFGALSLSAGGYQDKTSGAETGLPSTEPRVAANGEAELSVNKRASDINSSVTDAKQKKKRGGLKAKQSGKNSAQNDVDRAKDAVKAAIKQGVIDRGVSEKDITQERLERAMKAQESAELNFDILTALELTHKDPITSMRLYEKAYKKTGSPVYLLEALKLAFSLKYQKDTLQYMKLGDKELGDNSEYLRIKIGFYLSNKENLNANTVALKLVTIDPSSRSYAILAATYYAMENFELARQYFEKAYELDKTDENLLRLCDVLFNKLKDADAAIRTIETHRRIYGCGGIVCEVLADVYRADKRYLDVAKIDEVLYEAKGDAKFLDDMIAIYYYSNDFDKIIEILKKYDYKPALLIDAYAQKKDYKTAIKLAREEFLKTKNYDFLAIEAIYEYESAGKNVDAKTLSSVVEKFENIAPQLKDAMHLNYYGYILIDHDLDVKKGIDYVQKALKIDPSSPYYIDSLAWGYYKLGECDKAKQQMDRIKDEEFFKSPEGKEHLEAIDACAIGGQKPQTPAPKDPVAKSPAVQNFNSNSAAQSSDLNPAPQNLEQNSMSQDAAAQSPSANPANSAPKNSTSQNFEQSSVANPTPQSSELNSTQQGSALPKSAAQGLDAAQPDFVKPAAENFDANSSAQDAAQKSEIDPAAQEPSNLPATNPAQKGAN